MVETPTAKEEGLSSTSTCTGKEAAVIDVESGIRKDDEKPSSRPTTCSTSLAPPSPSNTDQDQQQKQTSSNDGHYGSNTPPAPSEAPASSSTLLTQHHHPPSYNNTDASSHHVPRHCHHHRYWLLWALVVLAGASVSGVILALGITAARKDQQQRFDRVSHDLLAQFGTAFRDYVVAGLWLQQATQDRQETHQGFRLVYDYMVSSGLTIQAISWVKNVTHDERAAAENETRAYLAASYPVQPYVGFLGLEFTEDFIEPHPGARSEQPFYLPLRFVEPMENPLVRGSIDLDMWSLPPHRKAITEALSTWQPAATERLKLGPDFGDDAYFVIIMHPGAQTPSIPSPRDLSALTFPVKALIARAGLNLGQDEEVSLHIFDSTDQATTGEAPFLGAAIFRSQRAIEYIPELSKADIPNRRYVDEYVLPFTSRSWTFVIQSEEGSFEPDIVFPLIGALVIFVAGCGLALWLQTNVRRAVRLTEMKAAADAEKTALLIENSRRMAERERELNDWIAHEVRNPLSAALGACSFLSSEVHKVEPLQDEVSRQMVREDVGTIDKSLQFINELLRSMLDYNMVTSRQLKIELAPTDLLRDVLEPTAAMLYNRSENFEILLECPENLVVMTDGLRLKQITLNLSRNSAKFVQKGFVKFKVVVIDESVSIYVEDSGPGIPASKRDKLFAKFQESLDSLNQGTGVGLSLCKSLADLLGGELWLDQDFESGIEGCPGSRFVIDLKRRSLSQDMVAQYAAESFGSDEPSNDTSNIAGNNKDREELAVTTTKRADMPDEMRVLFVDDDMMLRKLFRRSIQKTFPKWQVKEASLGESALQLVDSTAFDVIFMDQYMASTERTLLGTETVRALRAKNVSAIICGLSANDLERQFLLAGANCFCLKPFPCQPDAFIREMGRVLGSKK